jgi:hypothetical protein
MCSLKLTVFSAVLLSLAVQAGAAPAGPPIPRGQEIRVNTATNVALYTVPKVAVFPDGGFVVVWTSDSGVRARFFDRKGKPAGGERPLNLGIAGAVNEIVADRDGSFLVAWTGSTLARPTANVYVRRFNRDGTARGKAIRANDPSPNDRHGAVVAVGPDGRFAVAWRENVPIEDSPFPDSYYTNAVGRIFKASGIPATREIGLFGGYPSSPAGDDAIDAFPTGLALAPDGTLSALVKEIDADCYNNYLVRVPAGKVGTTRRLDSWICGSDASRSAALTMGVDGSLVAIWNDYPLVAQRFSLSGAPRGEPLAVSQSENRQAFAGVALQAGGSFVVVWTDLEERDGVSAGVYGRAFTANGVPRTGDFLINTSTEGAEFAPAIAAARQGPVVVVWTQNLDQNEPNNIFARVLSAEP